MNEQVHKSVLLDETIGFLSPADGRVFIDATLGLGGHAKAILECGPGIAVIGIDQDPDALKLAKKHLANFGKRVRFYHANFSDISRVAAEAGVSIVDGILADLGISSLQLDDPNRGFSFRFDAPLDMRMDPQSDRKSAAELLASLDEEDLANLIYRHGEERKSRRIARRIVERRMSGRPVESTKDLADLIEKAIGRAPKDKIHPATRTFQALRIAVNNELEILEKFIEDAIDLLKTDGRLCVITFHSLEDRIVKRMFQKLSGKCFCPPRIPKCICGAEKRVQIMTRKPVVPSASEIQENPRSRSAKLRVCQKLPA